MKDEVPPALTDAHVKLVEEAQKEGKTVDSQFGLEKSGIAGTAPEKEEGGCYIWRGKGGGRRGDCGGVRNLTCSSDWRKVG